tara:strand:+ start:264 stop:1190 length:927 start_codon:yes stop_codon:yes gene_type:complete
LNKLKYFIILLILFLSVYIFIFFTDKKNQHFINIEKGQNIESIVELILYDDNYFNKKIYLIFLKFYNNFFNNIKYGEFQLHNDLNLLQITKIITNPSNYYREFQIIDGWEEYQVNQLIKNLFNESFVIKYDEILADKYKYQSHNNIEDIYKLMKKNKDILFSKYKNDNLLNKYSIMEIMIISSLVEKEGKTDHDKRLISSVIMNRLDKNIKLQIDATTIFSITGGQYKFNRKLNYNDLKYKNKYNTYFIRGLPPSPICFVSRKTIELVMENYKSDYLFYFYNEKIQKHIFSKTFKKHKELLNIYRNNE